MPKPTRDYCVYTVLLGNYEALNEQPVAAQSAVDFICFTDNRELNSRMWKMQYVDPIFPMDPIRSSRLYKICPHRFLADYRASLYIDNSVQLAQTPEAIFSDLLSGSEDLVCVSHSFRETLLDEFNEVVQLQLDNLNTILEQLNAYNLICPELLSQRPHWAGLLLRNHHDEEVVAAMEIWLAQIFRYSRRDQLSFDYALSRRSVRARTLDLDNFSSKYHTWPHAEGRLSDNSRKMGLLSTTSEVLLRKMAESQLREKTTQLALANVQLVDQQALLDQQAKELVRKDKMLAEFQGSRAWRFLQPLRRWWLRLRGFAGQDMS